MKPGHQYQENSTLSIYFLSVCCSGFSLRIFSFVERYNGLVLLLTEGPHTVKLVSEYPMPDIFMDLFRRSECRGAV
jgi:hypothetical protein